MRASHGVVAHLLAGLVQVGAERGRPGGAVRGFAEGDVLGPNRPGVPRSAALDGPGPTSSDSNRPSRRDPRARRPAIGMVLQQQSTSSPAGTCLANEPLATGGRGRPPASAQVQSPK
jgi:hypothetical protein